MKKFFVVLFALAVIQALTFAQAAGGDIYGTVVLKDNAKGTGVLITLEGRYMGKWVSATTDEGTFRFLNLPSGQYDMKFEMEGYKTVVWKDISVNLGKSSIMKIAMDQGTKEETVTVPAKVGSIDTKKYAIVYNIDRKMLESIPAGRNIWAELALVPGMMVSHEDIGGSRAGQPPLFSANGADPQDNRIYVDGALIADPTNMSKPVLNLDANQAAEIQVTTGANDISSQSGGVQVNILTKRAGRNGSGDIHFYVTDKALEMNKTPTDYMTQNGLVFPGMNRAYNYGLSFGNAILKDKLWWYGSYGVGDIHRRTETNLEESSLLHSGYAKVNFKFSTFSGNLQYIFDNKKQWGVPILSHSQQDTNSLRDGSSPTNIVYGSISEAFRNLLFTMRFVSMTNRTKMYSKGSTLNASTWHEEGNEYKIINNSRIEGSSPDVFSSNDSKNFSMGGNYWAENTFGGDHDIRFGIDFMNSNATSQTLVPNQRIAYIDRNDPTMNYLGIYPDYKSDLKFKRFSAFIQDSFTLGKFTFAAGIHYDKENSQINPLTQNYFTWYEPSSKDYHGKRMFEDEIEDLILPSYKVPFSWQLVSPRFAVTFDITGNGKNVIKLSAGRYMSSGGNRLAANYIPHRYGYAYWNDANGDEIPQFTEVGALFFKKLFEDVDIATGRNKVQYASDYGAPRLDELILSFEKELMRDFSATVSGFYKKKSNLAFDINSNGEYTAISKGIMSNGDVETNTNWKLLKYITVGGTQVPVYEQIDDTVGKYYYNYKDSYYRYMGIEFRLNKKLSHRWMANLSVTIQNNKRFLAKNDLLDLNNYDYLNEGQVAPVSGGIWMNSRWIVKFNGMYQLPLGLNLSVFYQAREGYLQPYSTSLLLNQGKVYFYRTGIRLGDDSERLPNFHLLNLGLEKTIRVSDTISATLVCDWYNVTNEQIETKWNTVIGSSAPTAKKPTMWTNPGIFQFGVRVNF